MLEGKEMAKVTISDLYKSYGSVEVLKGINLHIEDGGFLVLVGPSGCGKSTLLNTIAGLEEITSGDIEIGKNSVAGLHPSKRNIAMVFQSYALYPNMTVSQNIGFGMEMKGIDKNEREISINKVAETLQISELLNRKPGQLSGGQRQRVAMGRAIVREPEVFLFDEPLSNLDAKLRIDMRTEIKRLHQRLGSTIIYVTHDQVEAMTLATKIAVLKDGCIQQFDTPYEIYNNPSNMFVANFMGAPAMNLIEGNVVMKNKDIEFEMKNNKGDVISLPIDDVKGLENYINKTVVFGIRPESINDLELSGKKTNKKLVEKEVEIDVVEPAGSDTYAIVEFGGKQVVTRLNGNSIVAAGEKVKLTFNLSQAVFFNIDTEERIR
ncbi:sugar ABC transporter ATPase [Candidatus Pseudothioglobus singularis PS1]|uniref:Sugar ABC transporter ATPase n=2 Tax=Candidatus Pseudothioglobus TaxID=2841677 RepID=A0A0M4LGV9_9GAMM|nr:sugar ABC transporter ATPase [Candidatus Pseudothioglobus singularis PS1]